jgi:hypothetical protein
MSEEHSDDFERARLANETESPPNVTPMIDDDEGSDAHALPPDPETATADDLVDEDTRESYANLVATRRFLETSEEDQRILRLQQAEITDLLERAEELGKNEYFDVKYFTTETKRVWEERELQDRTTTDAERPYAVRLFPNAEAAEHQRLLFLKLREDHALEDREELKRRHPLLFNRVVRDESRREVFKQAMEARREYQTSMQTQSALPLLLLQQRQQLQHVGQATNQAPSTTSCASSILNARKAPYSSGQAFNCLPEYIRRGVQRSAPVAKPRAASGESKPEDEWIQHVQAHMEAADQIVEGAALAVSPPKPPTLTEMLAAQDKQLVDLATREETRYKPLLESYFRYDAMVRGKLDKLAGDLGVRDDDLPPAAGALTVAAPPDESSSAPIVAL